MLKIEIKTNRYEIQNFDFQSIHSFLKNSSSTPLNDIIDLSRRFVYRSMEKQGGTKRLFFEN